MASPPPGQPPATPQWGKASAIIEALPERTDTGLGTPRWVKVQGVALILLIVVVAGMSSELINLRLLGFQHGPGGHGLGHHALFHKGNS